MEKDHLKNDIVSTVACYSGQKQPLIHQSKSECFINPRGNYASSQLIFKNTWSFTGFILLSPEGCEQPLQNSLWDPVLTVCRVGMETSHLRYLGSCFGLPPPLPCWNGAEYKDCSDTSVSEAEKTEECEDRCANARNFIDQKRATWWLIDSQFTV